MTLRSRPLLDAIAALGVCTVRAAPQCGGGQIIPAHSDELIHGKGKGTKASDAAAAACCPNCHDFVGAHAGSKAARDVKQSALRLGIIETHMLLWDRGVVALARGGRRAEPAYQKLPKIVTHPGRL